MADPGEQDWSGDLYPFLANRVQNVNRPVFLNTCDVWTWNQMAMNLLTQLKCWQSANAVWPLIILRSSPKSNDPMAEIFAIKFFLHGWAANPSTGALGNSLTSNTWYDAGGNEIKSLPAGSKLFTKTSYDILGRVTIQYVGFDVDETTYAEAQTVTGDTILEQQEMSYNAVGAVAKSVLRQRYHDVPATNAVKDFYQQIRRPLWWPDDVRFPTPTGVAQQSLGSP